MLVPVKQAVAFVNSHAPIYASVIGDHTMLIWSEEVDRDGNVTWTNDGVSVNEGLVSLKVIRDILGY